MKNEIEMWWPRSNCGSNNWHYCTHISILHYHLVSASVRIGIIVISWGVAWVGNWPSERLSARQYLSTAVETRYRWAPCSLGQFREGWHEYRAHKLRETKQKTKHLEIHRNWKRRIQEEDQESRVAARACWPAT